MGCIDFVWQELSILKQVIKRPSEKEAYFPCIPGAFLNALCDVISDIYQKKGEKPLTTLLLQVLKDLRCSLFLFWSGHFRNAMQVLRPALENSIVAFYFDLKGEEGQKEFEKWASEKERETKSELSLNRCLAYIEKNAIRAEARKEWRKERKAIEELYSNLSEYLHASTYETLERCEPGRPATCPEVLKIIDKEKADKWFSAFLFVVQFILKYLIYRYQDFLKKETVDSLAKIFSPESLSYCQPQKREFLVKFGDFLRQILANENLMR
jgi:hypothetical protein